MTPRDLAQRHLSENNWRAKVIRTKIFSNFRLALQQAEEARRAAEAETAKLAAQAAELQRKAEDEALKVAEAEAARRAAEEARKLAEQEAARRAMEAEEAAKAAIAVSKKSHTESFT